MKAQYRISLAMALAILCGTALWLGTQGGAAHGEPHIPSEVLGRYLSQTSQEQRFALEDGVITQAEYEAAIGKTVACLRAGGVSVSEPTWQGHSLQFVFSADSADAMQKAQAVYQDCYVEHQREVAMAWTGRTTDYQEPSARQGQDYGDELVKCLRGGGLNLPEHAAFKDVVAALKERSDEGRSAGALLDRCQRAAATSAGLPIN